jgi:hypothetical protein
VDERALHAVVAAVLRGRAEEAEALLAELDGALFREWATAHGLASVLHEQGREGGELRRLLRSERLWDVAEDMARAVWVPELLRAARERGVEVLAFKGCGIAHMPDIYRSPDLRPLGDLDVLVRPEAMTDAVAASEAVGFRPVHQDPAVLEFLTHVHYDLPLVHPDHGSLEIHRDLYRDIPSAVTSAMCDRAVDARIYGEPARILAPVDLFLALSVHFATTVDRPRWIWLVDLRRLGRLLTDTDWHALRDLTLAAGAQVFVLAALGCLETVWGPGPRTVPEDVRAALERAQSQRERSELERFLARMPGGSFDGDRLSMARRLSGRPVRGSLGVLSSLFCHPGAVCIELGVRSDSPMFVLHRARHIGRRVRRALRAVIG